MFGSSQSGANSYAKVGMETGVSSANPHKLIAMLFDGAMIALVTGIQQMNDGNIAGKGKSISKAINIIDNGLRASLDKKVGGEIALSLDSLYEYMSNRLLVANLKNQPELLQEVYNLLSEIKGAWDAIGNVPAPSAVVATAAADAAMPQILKTTAYESLLPRTSTFVSA